MKKMFQFHYRIRRDVIYQPLINMKRRRKNLNKCIVQ